MNKTMHLQEEAARCLLCADAPCSKACKNGDPARAIRTIRFDNEAAVGQGMDHCSDADLRQRHLDGKCCVSCHLCRLVCPTGAICMAKRVAKKG